MNGRKHKELTDEDQQKFFSALPDKCCGLCRHFDEFEPPTYGDHHGTIEFARYTGWCRVNPPVIKVIDEDDPDHLRGVWPCVAHHNWCGRFEAHPKSVRAEETNGRKG